MGQFGISIKFWTSLYHESTNEFKHENSVAYLFQDRDIEDLVFLSTTLKHLVGNDSLDDLIKDNIPKENTHYGIKGKEFKFFVPKRKHSINTLSKG